MVVPGDGGPVGVVVVAVPGCERIHILHKKVVVFLPLSERRPYPVVIKFDIVGEYFGKVIYRQPGRPGYVERAASRQSGLQFIPGLLGVGSVEGYPAVERSRHGKTEGGGGAVSIASHERKAPAKGLDVIAATTGSAVVYVGAFSVFGAEIYYPVPKFVVTLYSQILCDSGTGQPGLFSGLGVEPGPGFDGIGIVVLAELPKVHSRQSWLPRLLV